MQQVMSYQQACAQWYDSHYDPIAREEAVRVMNAYEDAKEARLSAPDALAKAAHWYAGIGIPVFPCVPGEKRPACRHGFKDATTNLQQIAAWWGDIPQANIGIPTGILFDAIDIDSFESADELWGYIRRRDIPRPGLTVWTPRGRHYLIPPRGHGNTTQLLPGIDYRGKGGYVVAPPSKLHPKPGRPRDNYRWGGWEWPTPQDFQNLKNNNC
ncbi:bifunctional DNA primase/polymerase [Actinotignum schaalii]|uniref:bifunctional DNA primase/polymerase n=1 Tax=Actinotignum TaxID=1653174 RepID=UPI00237DB676|nr:bifunctional DNA primase/polymerase [Actinotignum sanguinis]MDE1552237.1 bifunctional DNA primase/polymerase [Actinotignum sanguinis]